MSKLFLINIDMNGNEIDNVVIQPLAAAPANPTIGRIYYDTSEHALKTYNGSGWNQVGAVTSVNGEVGVVVLDQDDVGDGETYKRTHNDLTDTLVALINGAIQASTKGAANGVAELDSNGKVPSSQLPSYVDDVIIGLHALVDGDDGFLVPSTAADEASMYAGADPANITWASIKPEVGKIYVDYVTDKSYRYNGNSNTDPGSGIHYVEISSSIALGETSSTAYRGDRGKTAYDHSQLTSGNPHNVSKSDIGLGNVDNTSDATKKTNFTGSIASGDTGFVTGGAVYTALNGKSHVGYVSNVIGTSATSCTVTIPTTSLFIGYLANDGQQIVELDVSLGNNGTITFSVASAPSTSINCFAFYLDI